VSLRSRDDNSRRIHKQARAPMPVGDKPSDTTAFGLAQHALANEITSRWCARRTRLLLHHLAVAGGIVLVLEIDSRFTTDDSTLNARAFMVVAEGGITGIVELAVAIGVVAAHPVTQVPSVSLVTIRPLDEDRRAVGVVGMGGINLARVQNTIGIIIVSELDEL